MGRPGKGKGRSNKGKDPAWEPEPPVMEDPEQQFQSLVSSLLPPSAHQRAETRLAQAEWSVQVTVASLLRPGMVAFVRKNQLPDVLRKLPETTTPTAIITTEHAESLGLRHYHCEAVQCTLEVPGKNDVGGYRQKYLTQMGFGGHVKRLLEADVEVAEVCSMLKLVFHLQEGSEPSMASGTTVLHYLEAAGVPAAAVSDVIIRSSTSATALVHEEYIDRALRQSGSDGWFCKPHSSEDMHLELVWLSPDLDRQRALDLQMEHASSLGLATTIFSHRPRYALRFATETLAQAAHRAMGGSGQSEAHFKIEGIRARVGAAGLLIMLERMGWKASEVIYMEEHVAVFVASVCVPKMRVRIALQGGGHSMAQIKAVNSAAKRMVEQTAKTAAAAAAAHPKQSQSSSADGHPRESEAAASPVYDDSRVRRAAQQRKQTGSSDAAHPSTPRRRPAEHSGATPDAQRQRTEQTEASQQAAQPTS